MAIVLSCPLESFDGVSGTCSAPVYVELAGGIAPLSASDGALLAVAVVTLWCVGAAFRWARKALMR